MELDMYKDVFIHDTRALTPIGKPYEYLFDKFPGDINKCEEFIAFNGAVTQCKSILDVFKYLNKTNSNLLGVFQGLWDVAHLDNVPLNMFEAETYTKQEILDIRNILLFHFVAKECPLEYAEISFIFAIIMRGYARIYNEASKTIDEYAYLIERPKYDKSLSEENSRLKNQISDKDALLSSKQELLNEQQLEIDRLKELLRKKDEEISTLTEDNRMLKQAFTEEHSRETSLTSSVSDGNCLSKEDAERFRQLKVILFGGPDGWQCQVRDRLDNITFVQADDVTFHNKIIDKADAIALRPDYMSHKQYYRAVARARQTGVPMVYISNNIDKLQQQILEAVDSKRKQKSEQQ